MSQNRTVIQGLEPANASGNNNNFNFYARKEGEGAAKGTIVPGMMGNPSNTGKPNPNPQAQPAAYKQMQSDKPIVGFLYSISRTAAGEYWPLHIGQNTIGKNTSCDIVLPEGTVSAEHAVLVVRKMKNPEKVIASISDARSTNGTMLNGESLGFSAVECQNGNIITIGDNYELLLILIDPASLGLTISENFIHIEIEEDEPINDNQDILPYGYTRPGEGYQPYNGPTPPHFGGYTPGGGTIGIDGSSPSGNKGGTVGM